LPASLRKEKSMILDSVLPNPQEVSETSETVTQESTTPINTPRKNLISKIDSILRNLENLNQKKLRIEFEIKKQKFSLHRKRDELKKAQKSLRVRTRISLESADSISEFQSEQELDDFLKRCSKYLSETQRVLDEES
jgi:hypothetical protein